MGGLSLRLIERRMERPRFLKERAIWAEKLRRGLGACTLFTACRCKMEGQGGAGLQAAGAPWVRGPESPARWKVHALPALITYGQAAEAEKGRTPARPWRRAPALARPAPPRLPHLRAEALVVVVRLALAGEEAGQHRLGRRRAARAISEGHLGEGCGDRRDGDVAGVGCGLALQQALVAARRGRAVDEQQLDGAVRPRHQQRRHAGVLLQLAVGLRLLCGRRQWRRGGPLLLCARNHISSRRQQCRHRREPLQRSGGVHVSRRHRRQRNGELLHRRGSSLRISRRLAAAGLDAEVALQHKWRGRSAVRRTPAWRARRLAAETDGRAGAQAGVASLPGSAASRAPASWPPQAPWPHSATSASAGARQLGLGERWHKERTGKIAPQQPGGPTWLPSREGECEKGYVARAGAALAPGGDCKLPIVIILILQACCCWWRRASSGIARTGERRGAAERWVGSLVGPRAMRSDRLECSSLPPASTLGAGSGNWNCKCAWPLGAWFHPLQNHCLLRSLLWGREQNRPRASRGAASMSDPTLAIKEAVDTYLLACSDVLHHVNR